MAELVPAGAWDTHIHVFDPEKFPYAANRPYTPGSAQLSEYPFQETGCKNIVIVHASMQGTSPEALLDTLQKQHSERFKNSTLRGLTTIGPDNINDAELDNLHKYGVRGERLNRMFWGHGTQSGSADILNDIKTVAGEVRRLHWVVSVFCPLASWAAIADGLRALDPRINIVADHFGGSFPGDETTAEFETFLQLVRDKKIFVKLSGFERWYHGHANGMEAIEPIAKAIIEAGPSQILYGSDWPHTGLGVSRRGKTDEQRLNDIEAFRDVPDAEHIRMLRQWIKDDTVWEDLFVNNPRKLFD